MRDTMAFVWVEGGSFDMGSDLDEIDACCSEWRDRLVDPAYRPKFRSWIMKEHPKHRRSISAFLAMVFPVSIGEYRAFLSDNSDRKIPEPVASGIADDHPVWGVGFEDAEAYAAWLGQQTGVPWRLPEEHEWEWMARGPARLTYPFGATFDEKLCNTVESGIRHTVPIGHPRMTDSWCGVRGLAGNVEEWTASPYRPYPCGIAIVDDLVETLGFDYRVLRGGSFNLGGDLARGARRHGPHPGHSFRITGLRLVADGPVALAGAMQ